MTKITKNLFFDWFFWHFKEAPIEIYRAWVNFLIFNFEFFSIGVLLRTLFSPWERVSEGYSGGISNISENIQVLILNGFSRILGFLVRIIFIIIGILFQIAVFICGLFIIVFWFIFPFLIVFGIFISFFLIF